MKPGRIQFRIPGNLDVKQIINKHPLEFHGAGLREEKLLYICDALVKSMALHWRTMEDDNTPYAPLCAARLDKVVHNYDKYLKFLTATKIMLCDNHYTPGEKCKGYRYNAPYTGQKLQTVTVYNVTFKNTMRAAAEAYKEEVKKSLHGYSYITKWWETERLEIDIEAANDWIDDYSQQRITEIQASTSKYKEIEVENVVNATESFRLIVEGIHTHRNNYRFSGEGHRFYSPITNLKRGLRQFLTYNGQPLIEIDIKNSQPLLTTVLLQQSFWMKVGSKPCLQDMCKEIYKKVNADSTAQRIIMLLKAPETIAKVNYEITKYSKLVVAGKFYEHMQPFFEALHPAKTIDRNYVKTQMLTIMFSEAWRAQHYTTSKVFREEFPTIYDLFTAIKNVQHNYLPIILQRIESFLVIDKICKRISKERSYIPLFTIHDNIITTVGHEVYVQKIMEEEVEAFIGYKPTLACKELTRKMSVAM